MSASASPRKIALDQLRAALFAFSAMAILLGCLAWCVRSPGLGAWVDKQVEYSCRQTKMLLYHRGWFQEQNDLWMYDTRPATNLNGGVYFLGSSYVVFGTMFWKLPPEQQALIHNYGMPASNAQAESLMLRYLADKKNLTNAPEKSLVVLGAAYQTSFYESHSLPPSWTNSWERHGLFATDIDSGIQTVPVSPLTRFFRLEETQEAGVLTRAQMLLTMEWRKFRNHGVEPARVHNPEAYKNQRKSEMGEDWKRRIAEAIDMYRGNIEWLQARHVQVRVAFMPEATWEDSLPFSAEYRRQLTALCAEKHVPISDWSKLLPDDDFADSAHPNIFGMEKEQNAFLQMALPFLESTHAFTGPP